MQDDELTSIDDEEKPKLEDEVCSKEGDNPKDEDYVD
jgi:hypothetical protein